MHWQPRNSCPCNAHCGIEFWTAMLVVDFEKATVSVVKRCCLFFDNGQIKEK